MKDEDVKKKFGPDEVGAAGKAFHISSGEGTDKFLVSFKIEHFNVVQESEGDNHLAMIAAISTFKHLFKPHFALHDLNPEDAYIFFEVDKNYFRDEVRVTIEDEGKPVFFALNYNEISEFDPTKWVPKVRLSKELEEELKAEEGNDNISDE